MSETKQDNDKVDFNGFAQFNDAIIRAEHWRSLVASWKNNWSYYLNALPFYFCISLIFDIPRKKFKFEENFCEQCPFQHWRLYTQHGFTQLSEEWLDWIQL